MIIIWGSRLFGKVDVVPGLFHVATKFFHVWYLPLIPLGSHLVTEEHEDGWIGIPVGLSGKSVFIAWIRTAAFLATIVFAVMAVAQIAEGVDWFTPVLRCLICGAILAGTYLYKGFSRASYERAVYLAERAEIGEGGLVFLDLAFERITEEEAERRLQELEASQPPQE